MAETAVFIDGNSYAYRAFHALAGLSTSAGQPTGAVYGFAGFLLGFIADKRPTYLAVAFDARGPTFRHEAYAEYKANRPPMPDELASQMDLIKRMVGAWGVPIFEVAGVEADDVLATLAVKARDMGVRVSIVTSDKDALQLVDGSITVTSAVKESLVYDEAEVEKRYGVPPAKMAELLALTGDSTDNVPGVPGVGPKTAAKLLTAAGSIEALLADPSIAGGKALPGKLRDAAETVRLSLDLVTLRLDVPVEFDREACRTPPSRNAAVYDMFRALEFRALLPRVLPEGGGGSTTYDTEGTEASLERAASAGRLGLGLEPSDGGLRIALAWAEGEAAAFALDSMDAGSRKSLARLLASGETTFVAHDVKALVRRLDSADLPLGPRRVCTMLGAYLLEPGSPVDDPAAVAAEYASMHLPPEPSAEVLCMRADAALRSAAVIERALDERGQTPLFEKLEMPLVPVLLRMEAAGIAVDLQALGGLAEGMRADLARLEAEIHELAGEEFNVNSPKQLQYILFEKLGLQPVKKTKTGYSTNTHVLQALASQHLLPTRILEYRTVAKLLSTYVEALPPLVGPDGRLRTTFNQAVTATGRLSSSEPNLQNIPVRSEMGGRIRQAFVAGPGCTLVSADYSQVELRILAQMAEDDELAVVFRDGGDVHNSTAAALYQVDPGLVSSDMRRTAKMVNFGLIYGMSPYGLASRLNLPRATAKAFIDRYFERYPGVRAYMERIVELAREDGYVETLLGRRRYLPDLASGDRVRREAAEREAINMPVQGTAADMIKAAMIAADRALTDGGFAARMILQVHDELLFEAPEDEAERVADLARRSMCDALPLSVPVVVDVGYGGSWLDAH